ncbi:MAG: bifunctional proline dehydrogenase/L-glutamate gamma-semialdehyde dehydrogenase PutA [Ectothiorhodospiraceae bacterium]|jgi:RHH-type proline utilization regulon transcriptional repressor/proline dehydrogenase/delta 1-pyrroline-5-carboxylate dehydrogenase
MVKAMIAHERLSDLRAQVRDMYLPDEPEVVRDLLSRVGLQTEERHRVSQEAAGLVKRLRADARPGLMESLLAEYGLSNEEGVALMCLAEALLRVPDSISVDALIRDKIAPARWSRHLGHSSSSLVNASTWGLLLTGKITRAGGVARNPLDTLRSMVRRLGEPVIRRAVTQAMRVMGRQFVLGRSIEEAVERAESYESRGYTYSYDMLGEAARTAEDARRYFESYSNAIAAMGERAKNADIRDNPGISIKLSSLHPRYEYGHRRRMMRELAPRVLDLARQAKRANIGLNIDAEEQDRLDLSLDVIDAVLSTRDLRGWDGFGVVVQAYSPRALPVLEWLYELAGMLDRRIMVRLVKGAYWDTEVKRAQVQGLDGYPVFTRKSSTDVSYLACARRLLEMSDRIYPQFATHNAHSIMAIRSMAGDFDGYEFQRLHGMGESLHELAREESNVRTRIYAPVGVHEDLLAYLVRRILENGANNSFVNQIVNEDLTPEQITRDPIEALEQCEQLSNPKIPAPSKLFGPDRRNSQGWDLTDPRTIARVDEGREPFHDTRWRAMPIVAGERGDGAARAVGNPARPSEVVGEVLDADGAAARRAITAADNAGAAWRDRPAEERARILERVADLYEAHTPEFLALVSREAGKNLLDGVAEVREAVDFLRYYANEARRQLADGSRQGRGVFVCISPWNFPLAIFTGQIAAALAAGNAVVAKPAEQTSLIGFRAAELMHEAGVPAGVLNFLPGPGRVVGQALVSDERVAGVCFTGSTETAQLIHKAMAAAGNAETPLIAETGGLNAMIVDSTALPEQVVRDVVASAFQSAGQRCSALRLLCLQEDVAERVLTMLKGAMEELSVGDPWELSTDVGPVIDEEARDGIESHCSALRAEGRLLAETTQGPECSLGSFVTPKAFRLDGIEDLTREVFGPILHVVTFRADDLNGVVDRINAQGYGLTMGVHTRIDHRVQAVSDRAKVGNLYVNRNQIGAIVGSQPFGGEGLSGTGPKAGGPHYLQRFTRSTTAAASQELPANQWADAEAETTKALRDAVAAAAVPQPGWSVRGSDRCAILTAAAEKLDGTGPALAEGLRRGVEQSRVLRFESVALPGPTGESNRLSLHGRGVILCLGRGNNDPEVLARQVGLALAAGNGVVAYGDWETLGAMEKALSEAGVPRGLFSTIKRRLSLEALKTVPGIDCVAYEAGRKELAELRRSLAEREGRIVTLVCEADEVVPFVVERAISVDTTASGGNATLLAEIGSVTV